MANQIEKKIIEACLNRCGKNLATILIFGSCNTGNFIAGKSDIDLIILLKNNNGIKLQAAEDLLKHVDFADLKISIAHFRTLDNYKSHIYSEGTWSSWITVINGSKVIYSTKEFEQFKESLKNNPIPNNILAEYLIHKDKIELDGYFTRSEGEDLTKAYFSHMRRKLQILNYLQNNEIEFDYTICLDNLKDLEDSTKLNQLIEFYNSRKGLNNKEAKEFYQIAKTLTNKITSLLNK